MRRWLMAGALAVLAGAAVTAPGGGADPGGRAPAGTGAGLGGEGRYEVWLLDQADTAEPATEGGGTLYVYDGPTLAGAHGPDAAEPSAVVDLAGEARALCRDATGTAPRRPHMLYFGPADTHAVIAYVATGHVLFMDAARRTPVGCVDVGAQAHAAVPSPDGRHVVVANQNGKLLQRITTDYATGTFTLDAPATLDLAACTTPSGAACQDPTLRPDNAPICPVIDRSGRFTFVTLRGGGLLVVDAAATPMAIVAEYDRQTVHPNGCGGVEAAAKMYVNSGGGTAANPLESDLYAFPLDRLSSTPQPPNTPAPALVFSHDGRGFVDSHGAAATNHGRYLWVSDRAANSLVVVDTARDVVVNELPLAGPLSPDPAPDLLDVSPAGHRAFVALRGPGPLTANVAGVDNAVGTTPGLAVVRIEGGGRDGVLQGVARVSRVEAGVERADPHAIRVRRR